MSRRPPQSRRDRRLRSRWNIDKRRQRMLITVGVIIVLAILVIPAYGYYRSYIQPARTVAAQVGNATITMGDVVKTIRANYAMGAYQDPEAIGNAPFDVVYSMVQNELVYQAALRSGITVSDEEAALYIHTIFYPQPPEGEDFDPADLEREYKETYRNFLNQAALSEGEFRRMVRYWIAASKMRDQIAQEVPNQETQVEVYWILIPADTDFTEAQDALKNGRNFAEVCQDYNTDYTFADEDCYVGWIPKGAFPSLDDALFSIEHDVVSDPVATQDGRYFLKVVAGPEVRDISEPMRMQLEAQAYQSWTDSLFKQYQEAGLLRVTFDSRWYDWMSKELRTFLPTPTPTQVTPTQRAGG